MQARVACCFSGDAMWRCRCRQPNFLDGWVTSIGDAAALKTEAGSGAECAEAGCATPAPAEEDTAESGITPAEFYDLSNWTEVKYKETFQKCMERTRLFHHLLSKKTTANGGSGAEENCFEELSSNDPIFETDVIDALMEEDDAMKPYFESHGFQLVSVDPLPDTLFIDGRVLQATNVGSATMHAIVVFVRCKYVDKRHKDKEGYSIDCCRAKVWFKTIVA
jgi:hypothetical protein